METFVTHPERRGPFPAVIIYMDIWGVREELFDVARRIATVGYYCLVPDLYYREGRVRHDYRDGSNRTISTARLDEQRLKAVRDSRDKLTDAMAVDDTGALLTFMNSGEPVHPGPVGTVGYCMGGRHVFRVAAAYADRIQASASLHGTHLVTDKSDSPHRSANSFRGQLYCGFGEKDGHAAMSIRTALDEALKGAAKVTYRQHCHPGAEHGYALPDRDVYDKHAANRDWETIFAMFRDVLPAPA